MSAVSEASLFALFQSASQAILGVDLLGRMAFVNSIAEQMFGYGKEELLGAAMELLLPQAFQEVRSRGKLRESEFLGRRKDGREFPAEISLSHVRTADGGFTIAFISDLTQQKLEARAGRAGSACHSLSNMLTVVSFCGQIVLDQLEVDSPLREEMRELLAAADSASVFARELVLSRQSSRGPMIRRDGMRGLRNAPVPLCDSPSPIAMSAD